MPGGRALRLPQAMLIAPRLTPCRLILWERSTVKTVHFRLRPLRPAGFLETQSLTFLTSSDLSRCSGRSAFSLPSHHCFHVSSVQMSDLMGCYRTFPNLPEISSTVKQRFKPQHLLKGYGAVAKMHSRAQQAAVIKFNKRPAQPVRNVCQDLKSCKPCRS